MSGNSLVLDANIILYLLGGGDETIAELLDGRSGYVSVITELELIGYPDITDAEPAQIRGFLSGCTIINITDVVWTIDTDLRRRHRLKLGDAEAATTSICLDLPLVGADKAFGAVPELEFMRYLP